VNSRRAEAEVRKSLHGGRLEHSSGVQRLAARLARVWRVPGGPVEFAALLHDWAKEAPPGEFRRKVDSGAIQIDAETLGMPQLYHAYLSAHWIETRLDVHDPAILEAVRFHPTGAPGLGMLGRILFVADYAEEGRRHQEAEVIRTLAEKDLEAAVREVLKGKLHYLIDQDRWIHSKAWLFWNELLDGGAQSPS